MNDRARDKRQPKPDKLVSWRTREEMVWSGLALNLPWFAFVNISFALTILLRNVLLQDIDLIYHVTPGIASIIDGTMSGAIILSVVLIIMSWRRRSGISILLFALSLIWLWCCFFFITDWRLPHVWPLCITLLLAAMTALYFHPKGLLSFTLPLWLTLPAASYVLNQGINIRFAVVWSVFSLILFCGRFILLRWFDEAWRRNQQNEMLITRLGTLAHLDALTGVANRRSMEKLLNHAAQQKRAYSLIMLDVDYFKRYNDRYGHQAGDECLRRVAGVLKSAVRNPQDMVSRYGGEEFAIILFDALREDCERIARRIQQDLAQQGTLHEDSAVSEFVTISMGIASTDSDYSAQAVIRRADAALYRAKGKGRNCWSF